MLKKKYSEEYIHEATLYYSEYSEEKERMVDEMMRQLHPPTDEILRMCYLEQMKYSEVAEKMGISTSTVKKHIMKALRTLRERLLHSWECIIGYYLIIVFNSSCRILLD